MVKPITAMAGFTGRNAGLTSSTEKIVVEFGKTIALPNFYTLIKSIFIKEKLQQ